MHDRNTSPSHRSFRSDCTNLALALTCAEHGRDLDNFSVFTATARLTENAREAGCSRDVLVDSLRDLVLHASHGASETYRHLLADRVVDWAIEAWEPVPWTPAVSAPIHSSHAA